MKIRMDEAKLLFGHYSPEDLSILVLNPVTIRIDGESLVIKQGVKLSPGLFEKLQRSDMEELEVFYHEAFYSRLSEKFPARYRRPHRRKGIVEIDKLIENLDKVNSLSKRKRTILSLAEIYHKSHDEYSPLIYYEERLDQKRWNTVKSSLARNECIPYRFDGGGIILFYILKHGDPHYAQKFMKFTDLVSIIVESGSSKVVIGEDFCPETDVFTVNEADKLLQTYVESRASLIIVGEDIDEEYKRALNHVKVYDPYAKFMLVKFTDTLQKKDILTQVKAVYEKNTWLNE